MKSASSSVASDDTLEAAGSPASSSTAKDRLDLATDFPPLSASEVGGTSVSADQGFVPQWVTKSAFLVGAAEKVMNHGQKNSSNQAAASPNNFHNNSEISDENKNNNPNSSSSSFSTSAVIHDASDQAIQNPPSSELTTKTTEKIREITTTNKKLPPPPDVTVVPLQNNVIITSQKRTANAVMLPDIAAQAPNVMMNTTNRYYFRYLTTSGP